MKYALLAIVLVIVLSVTGYFLKQHNQPIGHVAIPSPMEHSQTVMPTMPIPQTPSSAQNVCTPSQLETGMQSEGAAGNIYITVTLKNSAKTSCQIIGNKELSIEYPVTITNFKTVLKRQPTVSTFTLAPSQTIYALIHYPNGPQCSSKVTYVDAMISYPLSASDSVTFKSASGILQIPSCANTSEITTLDIYPFSDKMVMP